MKVHSIKTRLIGLGLVPIILFALLFLLYVVPSNADNIFREKETQTREMVNIGLSILNYYYKMETVGTMTRSEAQAAAKEAIKSIRYGETQNDYFWINDFTPRVIVHPFRPDLIGHDVSGVTDPDGKKIFMEFVNIANNQKAGYVPYKWQYYDDTGRIEPKISYVATFEPWNWIIGTGVYVNDVNEIVRVQRNRILAILAALTVFTMAIIYWFGTSIASPIAVIAKFIGNVGTGDFTGELPPKVERVKTEIGEIARALHMMQDSLSAMFEKISDTLFKVNESSESLAASSQEMSASLEEVSASTQQFATNAQELTENAQKMQTASNEVTLSADQGKKAIEEAVRQMDIISGRMESLKNEVAILGDHAQSIDKIVDTIKGIADQTNLLALNAAIEAARAGERGRGFAVVAEEVRKLAVQSARSASEITRLITETQEQTQKVITSVDSSVEEVKNGISTVLSAGNVLGTIIEKVENITGQIDQVSAAAEEIGAGSEEVSAAVQEQTATMNDVSNAATELTALVDDLRMALSQFKY